MCTCYLHVYATQLTHLHYACISQDNPCMSHKYVSITTYICYCVFYMCTLHIIVYIADTMFTCNVTCACYVCMLHILCMHMIQYECSLFHMWNHTYQCVRCICYVCTLNTQSCMLCITVHTCTWYAMHTGCLICACYLSHMYIICDYM